MIASRHVRAVSVSKLGFSRGTNSSFRSEVYWSDPWRVAGRRELKITASSAIAKPLPVWKTGLAATREIILSY